MIVPLEDTKNPTKIGLFSRQDFRGLTSWRGSLGKAWGASHKILRGQRLPTTTKKGWEVGVLIKLVGAAWVCREEEEAFFSLTSSVPFRLESNWPAQKKSVAEMGKRVFRFAKCLSEGTFKF